ncbi:MFS transporter [Cellulomonas sp. 73-145]|uniref:MFS transporter n=1 Tax=Cellulomonas sp. 73-145 TaxID=1895739 RepID=UPI000AC57A1E|nr:MFS transporter [Cellulomonas sp. 73-145]
MSPQRIENPKTVMSATSPGHGPRPVHPAAILAIVLISYFMILLDNSVIFTGIPSIQAGLHLDTATLSWVQDAYTLVFGGLLLLGARAGDIIGRRKLFIVGLAVFGLASLLVGTAQNGGLLIAARAFQGVGAAIVAPTSLSLITANFTGRARARAIAWYAATAGIGASLGLLVGGAAAQWISWRAGFFINVPIAIAMGIAAARVLPETPRVPGRFDTVGAITATAGVGALVYGIVDSTKAGWTAPSTVAAIVAGLILITVLVLNEARAAQPIMPLRLFANRQRAGAYAVRMLYLGAMMGFFFFTTQYLQDVLGFTPLQAGAGFLPMTAVNFVVAMSIPRLGARMSQGTILTLGVLFTLIGMGWLSRVGTADSYWLSVAAPMVLIGIGQGLAFAPMTSAGVHDVQPEDAGAASGLVNTAHQLGSSLGLGILVTIAAQTAGLTSTGAAAVARHVEAALTGSSLFLVAALVVTVLFVAHRRSRA